MKESNKLSKSAKVVFIILPIIIILCACAIIGITLKDKKDDSDYIKNVLYPDGLELDVDWQFKAFADKCYEKQHQIMLVKYQDLENLKENAVTAVHLSMWDVSMLDPEWYALYFAQPIAYSNYQIKTPQEMCEYLDAAFTEGNQIDTVYINIDPYKLYEAYYQSVFYDSEILTYEEFLSDSLFKYLETYSGVKFIFFLPNTSVDYWATLDDEEIGDILGSWYTFTMFLRWWSNVEVAYMGDEEWLVANDLNYLSENTMVEDVSKLSYLYLYAFPEFRVNPPELLQKEEGLKNLIAKEKAGDYFFSGIEGQTVVFYGDSIFRYCNEATLNVPYVVSALTECDTYNLSIGGTTGSKYQDDSFPEVAGKGSGDDGERFNKEVTAKDNPVFVITYGFNDYLCGLKVSKYRKGLAEGVENIRSAFPDARIIMVSPYTIVVGNNGRDVQSENGGTLYDYINAMEEVAKANNCEYLDLYTNSGISRSNADACLEDGIHPNHNTIVWFAKLISEMLTNTED